jgi:hypothetical protein
MPAKKRPPLPPVELISPNLWMSKTNTTTRRKRSWSSKPTAVSVELMASVKCVLWLSLTFQKSSLWLTLVRNVITEALRSNKVEVSNPRLPKLFSQLKRNPTWTEMFSNPTPAQSTSLN